jgi:hypothetical protein
VVCCGSSHASAQQLERLRPIENSRKERALFAQSACGAMIAIDQWHPAAGWKSHHDAVT